MEYRPKKVECYNRGNVGTHAVERPAVSIENLDAGGRGCECLKQVAYTSLNVIGAQAAMARRASA